MARSVNGSSSRCLPVRAVRCSAVVDLRSGRNGHDDLNLLALLASCPLLPCCASYILPRLSRTSQRGLLFISEARRSNLARVPPERQSGRKITFDHSRA